jgi:hypothetical protein
MSTISRGSLGNLSVGSGQAQVAHAHQLCAARFRAPHGRCHNQGEWQEPRRRSVTPSQATATPAGCVQ